MAVQNCALSGNKDVEGCLKLMLFPIVNVYNVVLHEPARMTVSYT